MLVVTSLKALIRKKKRNVGRTCRHAHRIFSFLYLDDINGAENDDDNDDDDHDDGDHGDHGGNVLLF